MNYYYMLKEFINKIYIEIVIRIISPILNQICCTIHVIYTCYVYVYNSIKIYI
jgi:hypothetical protein